MFPQYIILIMSKRLKVRFAVLTVLFLITIFSIYLVFQESKQGILTVAFLNIGQGDSIFIEAPSGNQILIDGGPGRGVLRELSKVMPFYDRSIDVVLATHPDADHIGGLPDILKKYKTEIFFEPGVETDTNMYKELEKLVSEKESAGKIKKIEARRGMVVDLGGGTILEILYPVLDPRGMETNTASIVARLVYGENEFLLTGDSPVNIEDYLISQIPQGDTLGSLGPKGVTLGKGLPLGNLQADVLKAGHHGSRTSTSAEYVNAVQPEYVVISAGKDNKYGHPHQEVLDVLNSAQAKILRTDQDGRIVFESDGVNLKLK